MYKLHTSWLLYCCCVSISPGPPNLHLAYATGAAPSHESLPANVSSVHLTFVATRLAGVFLGKLGAVLLDSCALSGQNHAGESHHADHSKGHHGPLRQRRPRRLRGSCSSDRHRRRIGYGECISALCSSLSCSRFGWLGCMDHRLHRPHDVHLMRKSCPSLPLEEP